jgi:hypothetical protein
VPATGRHDTQVAFSLRGDLLASGGDDHGVHLWRMANAVGSKVLDVEGLRVSKGRPSGRRRTDLRRPAPGRSE